MFSSQTQVAQVCGPQQAQLHRGRRSVGPGPRKLFGADENPEDKLVAVIVTISEGSSYDEMFSTVKPTTVEGERVSTYAIGCRDVAQMHQLLSSCTLPESADTWQSLVEDVRAVPTDSVVFNWECCSACGCHAFPGTTEGIAGSVSETMRFIGFALRSGWTAMCSDFSLKSLIFEWSEEELGPNPLVQLGESRECQMMLEFSPAELQNDDVPQQLQVVGELCGDSGKAVVHAMSSTIVYSVNPKRARTDRYELKVLTVCTELSAHVPEAMKCSVGGVVGGGASTPTCFSIMTCLANGLLGKCLPKSFRRRPRRGAAGHVTLTYKEGGQLVLSNGHWIALTRIDVSLESVERAAAHNFGASEFADFQAEYTAAGTEEERRECLQSRSRAYVQCSAPTRMTGRTKFS